jgi:hypothetical protein
MNHLQSGVSTLLLFLFLLVLLLGASSSATVVPPDPVVIIQSPVIEKPQTTEDQALTPEPAPAVASLNLPVATVISVGDGAR